MDTVEAECKQCQCCSPPGNISVVLAKYAKLSIEE